MNGLTKWLPTVLLLVAVQSSNPVLADDMSEPYERYVVTREIEIQLFGAGMARFSKRLRAAAVLHACDRAGIAESVDLSSNESVKFLTTELAGKPASNGLTPATFFRVVASVNDQLVYYKIGYMDAIAALKRTVPGLCEAGVKLADEVLKERSAK
jgi:hypothetical protein